MFEVGLHLHSPGILCNFAQVTVLKVAG